ncbi:MAG: hypothetical protein ACLFPD_02355 [Desulfosudaceae bacterium]
MLRKIAVMAGLGVLICLIGCGGKYSDVIEVNQKFIQLMSAYVKAVDKVDNAGDAAAAINELADGMEKLSPRMKDLQKKYPELRTAEDLPEEIQMSEQEMETVSRDFGASFMKLAPYTSDPEVQQAQQRLSQVMSGLGQ